MSYTKSPMRGVPVVIIPAGSSATGQYQILAIPNSFSKHRFIVKTSAGVASGAVQPETSDDAAYAGTWAPIGGGPVTVPAASSDLAIEFEGVYNFLACRISTIIGGGTITVTYLGS
jgi:hypothetical protein